jgi:uncharacterized membrane protein
VIFNILGAICETLIIIILPCFFYVRLIKKNDQPKHARFYIAWVLLVLAFILSFCSIVSTVAITIDTKNY